MGVVSEEDDVSWIAQFDKANFEDLLQESTATQYITSLYFTISTLSTIGFGDVTPQNAAEMGFAIVLMLIGL